MGEYYLVTWNWQYYVGKITDIQNWLLSTKMWENGMKEYYCRYLYDFKYMSQKEVMSIPDLHLDFVKFLLKEENFIDFLDIFTGDFTIEKVDTVHNLMYRMCNE